MVAADNAGVKVAYKLFLNAYKDALAENGLVYDPKLVFQTGFGEDDGYFISDALLDPSAGITAIVLIFEVAAVGIYRRMEERGLKPGRDLSIIGFRDEPRVRHLDPRLTRYDLSVSGVGIALANTLLDQLNDQENARTSSPAQIRVPMATCWRISIRRPRRSFAGRWSSPR